MDTKIYEKTRYQNIIRHKKNKNLIIRINTPVRTSISRDELGHKIYDLKDAKRIRDNASYIEKKVKEVQDRQTFDELWTKYFEYCQYQNKLEYTTLKKKRDIYSKYLKDKIKLKVTKADSLFWSKYIDQLDCSFKQKNEIITQLSAFYSWCVDMQITTINPVMFVKRYKVPKPTINFWTIEELNQFIDVLDEYIKTNKDGLRFKAYQTKIITKLCFFLGDRIGETRALTFDCIDKESNFIQIRHSVEYDPKKPDTSGYTKNKGSQRIILIDDNFKNTLNEYKSFLTQYYDIEIADTDPLFFRYEIGKCYSDTYLRQNFYLFCDLTGIKKIKMQNLRHTALTYLSEQGVPIQTISKRAGHSSSRITEKSYLGYTDMSQKNATEILSKAIH